MKTKRKSTIRHRRFKKLIAVTLTAAIAISAMIVPTSAHTGVNYNDYHNEGYLALGPIHQANMKFMVEPSALNGTFLNGVIYDSVRTPTVGWNGITNNVHISSLEFASTNGTTPNGYVMVRGQNIKSVIDENGKSTVLAGKIVPYDVYGKQTVMDNQWSRVEIIMNTRTDIWGNNPIERMQNAQKVFIHEAGHTLKMKHPTCTALAVMQDGKLGYSPAIAQSIKAHDMLTLVKKWGQ